MFSATRNAFLLAVKRNTFLSGYRAYGQGTMGDPVEHATGIEKRELLSKLAGNVNPFDMRMMKRGPGTKAQPNEIPSAFDERIVGCICEEEQVHINWMWVVDGMPRRCECGFWFKLVKTAPL